MTDEHRQRDPSRPAELTVAALLLAAAVLATAFIVLYVVWPNTQALGATLGLALTCIAAALIVTGTRIVSQQTTTEQRPALRDEAEAREVASDLARGGEPVSRRRLLAAGAGAAGVSLAGAVVAPLASLGPNVGNRIDRTPWHPGRAVVDEQGRPISADDVTLGGFLTGYPEGADVREVGSPIVLVRVAPGALQLPARRRAADWAPEGIVAYSKICTHAGCAIALYRHPLYAPNAPRPALVCPCHYSTFDPARGAKRIFGPAGRALPQLPLRIEPSTRRLLAAGGFSCSIGPAWWGVKRG